MGKKKDEILGNKESLKTEDGVIAYDLNQEEKNELGAIFALIDQARLAQDILYTRLVNSSADRNGVKNSSVEINLAEVAKNGVDSAVLYATKKPEEESSADTE